MLESVKRLLDELLSCSFLLFCELVTKILQCEVERVKACGGTEYSLTTK
jgi:hypothetical protein